MKLDFCWTAVASGCLWGSVVFMCILQGPSSMCVCLFLSKFFGEFAVLCQRCALWLPSNNWVLPLCVIEWVKDGHCVWSWCRRGCSVYDLWKMLLVRTNLDNKSCSFLTSAISQMFLKEPYLLWTQDIALILELVMTLLRYPTGMLSHCYSAHDPQQNLSISPVSQHCHPPPRCQRWKPSVHQ